MISKELLQSSAQGEERNEAIVNPYVYSSFCLQIKALHEYEINVPFFKSLKVHYITFGPPAVKKTASILQHCFGCCASALRYGAEYGYPIAYKTFTTRLERYIKGAVCIIDS